MDNSTTQEGIAPALPVAETATAQAVIAEHIEHKPGYVQFNGVSVPVELTCSDDEFNVATGIDGVLARELTVRQCRVMLLQIQERAQDRESYDPINENLFEDMSMFEMVMVSNVGMAKLEGLKPSQLDKLVAAAKRANKNFFKMRAKQQKLVQDLLSKNSPELMALIEKNMQKHSSQNESGE